MTLKRIGAVVDGIQITAKDQVDVVAGANTVAKGDANGIMTDYMYRNNDTINQDMTVASGENAVLVGPVTVASGKTLTVTGTLKII